ncbi:MarR family transcriptional regulator [Kitasatospora sp. NPDC096128]|uniref:MarR family winged helix-turn-helix transcriptional regulator n=1 Tax=Kitasatospora sp. NPDC096128 TaxID=3155547 RepID=UPI00331A8D96
MEPGTAPPSDAPLADEFSALLAGIQRLLRRRLRRGLEQPRLRGAQVELLRLVMDSPGLRVSAAAEELCLAGNSVSTLVNQLAAQDLLRREADPADRRAALLYATGAAEQRLEAWRERRRALTGELLAALPERDRAALAAALPALRALARGLRDLPEEDPR